MQIPIIEWNARLLEKLAMEKGMSTDKVLAELLDSCRPMLDRYSIGFLTAALNFNNPHTEIEVSDEVIGRFGSLKGVGTQYGRAVDLLLHLTGDDLRKPLGMEDWIAGRVDSTVRLLRAGLDHFLFFPDLISATDLIRSKIDEIRSMDVWEAADISDRFYGYLMENAGLKN